MIFRGGKDYETMNCKFSIFGGVKGSLKSSITSEILNVEEKA